MDSLSDEVLIHIFAQGTAKDILLWRRVSGHWNNLINDDFVWKRAFENFWCNKLPVNRCCEKDSTWKTEYLLRTERINKMSNQRAKSMRIFTRRMEVEDISVTSTSVNVLDLAGLTTGHLSPTKFEAKCTLFFDKTFGDAPITFTRFLRCFCNDSLSLVIGLADGNVILYSKCPSRSLVEATYSVIGSVTSVPVHQIHQIPSTSDLLVVHESRSCFEFVTWNLLSTSPKSIGHFLVPDLKIYSVVVGSSCAKVLYVTRKGTVHIKGINETTGYECENSPPICTLDILHDGFELIAHPIKNSDWAIISFGSKILVINHETEVLVTSFNLTADLNISAVYSDNSGSKNHRAFELFIYSQRSCTFLKLTVEPLKNSIEQEIISFPRGNPFILDCWVDSVFLVVTCSDGGVFIYDSLSLRCLNKFYNSAKYLKRSGAIRRLENETFKFLISWGGSLMQLWDFDPVLVKRLKDSSTTGSSSADKALLGNKSLRKYIKYSLNNGISEWNQEIGEEAQLQDFRNRMNIEGLTEEEMIQYAKLISSDQSTTQSNQVVDFPSDNPGDRNDEDLQLALQLSLIDM